MDSNNDLWVSVNLPGVEAFKNALSSISIANNELSKDDIEKLIDSKNLKKEIIEDLLSNENSEAKEDMDIILNYLRKYLKNVLDDPNKILEINESYKSEICRLEIEVSVLETQINALNNTVSDLRNLIDEKIHDAINSLRIIQE